MGSYVELRFNPYEGWCYKCYRRPLVSENTRLGVVHSGLCGRCYFTDPAKQEPATWNDNGDRDEKQRRDSIS